MRLIPNRPSVVRHRIAPVALGVALLTVLASCGNPGSSGTTADPTSSSGDLVTCEAVPGDKLVVLDDDRKLQTVDNIVPAVNAAAAAADPAIVTVLDSVSSAMDTSKLIALNKAVDVDRRTASEVAEEFAQQNGLTEQTTADHPSPIVVGAGNFTESEVIARIYAAALEASGADVTVRTIGNRETYQPALSTGEVTIIPEYVGTLTEFLNKAQNGADAEQLASSDLDETMTALTTLGEAASLTFGTPSAAADQNAYAVTQGFADKYEVSTLSELAEACGGIVLGGPPECPERSFCQPGLEGTYGLDIASFVSLDAGGPLTKAALTQGKVTLGMVLSSDGALG